MRQHARRTVHRDDRCSQGEQFLSEYSGSASQIYPRVTRADMSCENRPEEMEPPSKSAPSITSGPAASHLLVETRPTRQPGRRGPGSVIQFTMLHCGPQFPDIIDLAIEGQNDLAVVQIGRA